MVNFEGGDSDGHFLRMLSFARETVHAVSYWSEGRAVQNDGGVSGVFWLFLVTIGAWWFLRKDYRVRAKTQMPQPSGDVFLIFSSRVPPHLCFSCVSLRRSWSFSQKWGGIVETIGKRRKRVTADTEHTEDATQHTTEYENATVHFSDATGDVFSLCVRGAAVSFKLCVKRLFRFLVLGILSFVLRGERKVG